MQWIKDILIANNTSKSGIKAVIDEYCKSYNGLRVVRKFRMPSIVLRYNQNIPLHNPRRSYYDTFEYLECSSILTLYHVTQCANKGGELFFEHDKNLVHLSEDDLILIPSEFFYSHGFNLVLDGVQIMDKYLVC